MAMACTNGASECSGCMKCFDKEEIKLFCPSCGKHLDNDSRVYIDSMNDDIIGCERCIEVKYAGGVEDRLI